MSRRLLALIALAFLTSVVAVRAAPPTNTFVIAAYNVENWLTMDRRRVPDQPKPDAEKAAVVQILTNVAPDVLGLIEIGTRADLDDLADRLAAHGLSYPYRDWVEGADSTRHLALLSRFPIVARDPQTNSSYRAGSGVFAVSRGFLDVTIAVEPDPIAAGNPYQFRVVLAHLKSKRPLDEADQAVMRLEEGRLLRRHLAAALAPDPRQNLLLMGDLNDTPESEVVRLIIGGDPFRLVDLMPVDRRGGHNTYHFRYRKVYERIDYLLANPAMQAEYVPDSARIADFAGWWEASDHRAIYARFVAADQDASSAAHATAEAGGGLTRGRLILIGVALFLAIDVSVLWWLLKVRRSPGA
ncbi:endonuclease/exonuclease/phosphatase family protein [bacterium]|nr:endonuclease/exonuclease/phosphatase family protein [bacterium]